jgi:hypothetical protein
MRRLEKGNEELKNVRLLKVLVAYPKYLVGLQLQKGIRQGNLLASHKIYPVISTNQIDI